MKRFVAYHPHWPKGHLIFYKDNNIVVHQESNNKGRYIFNNNNLIINWDSYPTEIFRYNGESFNFLFARPSIEINDKIANNNIDYAFLSSKNDDDALIRVQSTPLCIGLKEIGMNSKYYFINSDYNLLTSNSKYVFIHYNDNIAIKLAIKIKNKTGAKIIVMCSDIYNINIYVSLADIFDIFVAPTDIHAEILRSAINKPVVVIPEGIDPIAESPRGVNLPVAYNNKVCWFGYPESFQKSFKFILPLSLVKSNFPCENLAFITAPNSVLMSGFEHFIFQKSTFYNITSNFRYALLSHFAYDGHINSWIKSPNKLVTSIVRGLIPVVSNTPNYRILMKKYEIHEWMFSGPEELSKNLCRIIEGAHPDNRILCQAAEDLRIQLSPSRLAQIFLNKTNLL